MEKLVNSAFRGALALLLTLIGTVVTAQDALEEPRKIHVSNAGLVLQAPFLMPLLERLDLLIEDEAGNKSFADSEMSGRAVHLLQYLVDGSTTTPESLLVLNKVILGLPLDSPVPEFYAMTDEEIAVCDSLLQSIMSNWPVLSGTSRAGLQETFLQREGLIYHSDGRWDLRVDRKALDILIDQVPWGFSVILNPLMKEPLYVEWQNYE